MVTIDHLLFALTLLAALGSGLIAGVFFAFSTFVMNALARLPPGEGIAAMQSINRVVLSSPFIAAFFGTAAACLGALIWSIVRWDRPGAVYLFAGAALYLLGSLLVTIVFNVPRNQTLASVARSDPGAEKLWAGYVAGWTAWNHVRTAASLAAALAFSLALGR
jgi:uncharacterized membrane protein